MEMGTGDDLVNRPQSLAGVKLSGCKNATPAVRVDERSVRLPKWGIEARDAPRRCRADVTPSACARSSWNAPTAPARTATACAWTA